MKVTQLKNHIDSIIRWIQLFLVVLLKHNNVTESEDLPQQAFQRGCFLKLLMEAGASGLYYWEPELADDFDMRAWNPLTRKPSIALDAFLGVRHSEAANTSIANGRQSIVNGQTEYFTPNGMKTDRPQRGLNIVRKRSGRLPPFETSPPQIRTCDFFASGSLQS